MNTDPLKRHGVIDRLRCIYIFALLYCRKTKNFNKELQRVINFGIIKTDIIVAIGLAGKEMRLF